uniref:BolA-like protein 3 n=1 Tax=Parascaris equorum TaxID=6256 RepID=A0A914S5H9_PAREQ
MLRLRLQGLLRANAHRALCSARSQTEGGCGSMYQIVVECDDFKGLPRVRQHRLVTDTLKEEIASMHGITRTVSHLESQWHMTIRITGMLLYIRHRL